MLITRLDIARERFFIANNAPLREAAGRYLDEIERLQARNDEFHDAARMMSGGMGQQEARLAELRDLLGPEELCAIPQPARMRISEIVFGKTEMNSVNLEDSQAMKEYCCPTLRCQLEQELAIARHEAATHELVKREALATVQQLEQQVARQQDIIEQLKDRAEIVRDQLNTADSRAKESVQQEMAALRAGKALAEQNLTEVLTSLARLLDCDMQDFLLPADSGNHPLRQVIILSREILQLQKMANDRVAPADQPHPIASLMDELKAGRAEASEVPS